MKQRGDILIYALVGIAAVAALAGLVMAWNHYISGVDEKGYARGKQESEATYAKRDNEALRTATGRIKTLEDEARDAEAAKAAQIAAISTDYQRRLASANAQKDRDVAAARDGALVLRFTPDALSPPASGGGPGAQVAAGAPGRDGQAGTQLPATLTGRLFALADDADAVVDQLNSCQAVVAKDRE